MIQGIGGHFSRTFGQVVAGVGVHIGGPPFPKMVGSRLNVPEK